MKKRLIVISLLVITALLVWFSCNPFQVSEKSSNSFNVLDETDSVRATGATSIYVAPTGSDTNEGTLTSPIYSLSLAVEWAIPGTTIYMRGGKYSYSSTITLSQSGTSSQKISIVAYNGEKPVLDFSTQPYGAEYRAILLTGNYWYIKGLEICYAGDNGIKIEGSYNTIELCSFHHNGDSGVQLGFGHDFSNPDGSFCAYNTIINCDSYFNFDFDSKGGDADGFACKMHNGIGNKFIGCRAWHNSDDGWDLFETDFAVEIINCWTWGNGFKSDFDAIYLAKMGTTMSSFSGNGNGFKLGGNGTGGSSKGTHIVKNCIAFNNNAAGRTAHGFDQNSHKDGVTLYNCLAFNNLYNYFFEESTNPGKVMTFANCVSLAPGKVATFPSGTVEITNSWNLAVTVDNSDFASILEADAMASRQSDGSLPNNNFGKLVAGSDLIDKGTNVGLPYKGAAPDLGAIESY